MAKMGPSIVLAAIPIFATLVAAQSSCSSATGSIRPTVASGYALQLVATGLTRPRGLAFDDAGHLLVVEAGTGSISSHVVGEANGCVTLGESNTVVEGGMGLNHGIWVNGSTLYASNPESVYSWTYDASARTVGGNPEELINGMNNSRHTTRTLVLSEQVPGMMVVSRGSGANLDNASTTIEGGTAQVRAFNLNNRTGVYTWLDGLLLGWGNRNEVGLAEHPVTGGIYGVENSADQIERMGVDVHVDNPGEELNFFGYLNGTQSDNQGGFFGYPWCLSVWNSSELPDNSSLEVGDQFAFNADPELGNQNKTDAFCADDTVDARLVFQAHMAPLDIKFNNSGTEAWITFHGSWNRDPPVGYKLSVVQFENGEPLADSDSTTAAIDIVANEDLSACNDDNAVNCFRPVAMAIDTQGRIFMSSDATGEIYLVTRTSADNGTMTAGLPTSASGSAAASGTGSSSAASHYSAASSLFGAILAVTFAWLY